MITEHQIREMSGADRGAWIDALNEDESEILHCPVTRRCILAFVSLVKMLLAEEIPTEYRLKFLQWLERRDDWWCSPRIIAVIEPQCLRCAQSVSVDCDQDGKERISVRWVSVMSAAPQITNADVSAFLCAHCIPRGYAYSLVLISLTKHLLTQEMPAKERLEFLEHLEPSSEDRLWLTPEMVSAIEPMCEKGLAISWEAMKLGKESLDVLAEHFPTFAVLNRSLLTALKLRRS